MFTTPLVVWIEALLIVLLECGGVCCVKTTVQFHRFTALGEHFCPAEHVDIEYYVSSKTECLVHCVATPSCRSIGFEEGTFKCVKCSTGEFLENGNVTGNSSAALVYKRHERQGDLMFGNFSYRVVLEEKNWNDSKINCENMGGYLTSIKSSDEQEFLVNSIPENCFWIGGSGISGVLDSFKWLDNTLLSAGYNNWDTTSFSNNTGLDCVKMMRLLGYMWKNMHCDLPSGSFCKFG